MIYMNGDLQKKLIPLFHYALNPGGFLFLGTSETVGEYADLFSVVDRKLKLYQRKDDSHSAHCIARSGFLPPITAMTAPLQPSIIKNTGLAKLPLRELTEQALLKQFASAGVLIDSRGDILYLHGRTGMYLEPAPGEAGVSNVLSMAREGLKQELTIVLHKVAARKDIVRRQGLRVKTNGDYTIVNLTVCPVATDSNATSAAPLFLIILEAAPPVESSQFLQVATGQDISRTNDSDTDTDTRIKELKQELRDKEEYLQTANEELETTNEELKSSNEEMQSVNEELQSTNEELETSKEELQSVNEELSTVNAELQVKVADLLRTNNDMNNLLAGTGIATIFVDHQLRVLRFTPTANRIINLIPSDVGRPVSHVVTNLVDYDSMAADAKAVLDTLVAREVDIQTTAGTWYTMRIQPYRTLDNVIEGAVLTFVDISRIKQVEAELAQRKTPEIAKGKK